MARGHEVRLRGLTISRLYDVLDSEQVSGTRVGGFCGGAQARPFRRDFSRRLSSSRLSGRLPRLWRVRGDEPQYPLPRIVRFLLELLLLAVEEAVRRIRIDNQLVL